MATRHWSTSFCCCWLDSCDVSHQHKLLVIKEIFVLSISTLEVFITRMRYINPHLTFCSVHLQNFSINSTKKQPYCQSQTK